MEKVQIFWNPVGFGLGFLGATKISGIPTDGDKPCVLTLSRMRGIDTSEIHNTGNTNPSSHDSRLQEHAGWNNQGLSLMNADFATNALLTINTGAAGTLQKGQEGYKRR